MAQAISKMETTAVEWLMKQIGQNLEMDIDAVNKIIQQAKAMEKEQIMESWKHGNLPTFLGRVLTAEQYYNETYTQGNE